NLAFNFSFQTVLTGILSVTAAVFSDLLFLKIRKAKLFFPSAAIATGLIVGLLTDPSLPIYFPVLASILAMFTKNFIKIGRHIFNPASFGLILASLVFGATVSWSGVSWQILDISSLQTLLPFIILLSPGFVSLYKMRRWRIILPFLAVYFLGLSFFLKSTSLYFIDPTVIFFSLVMLPEPMTTPNHPKRQILFGVSVAALTILLSVFIFPSLNLQAFDPLIFSLLLGNLLFFRFR
ncbi:MAG: hypothetical protein A2396_02795, partial [Candidatus Levybacteria bacterium RIFOXYB1_FULL_40_17]